MSPVKKRAKKRSKSSPGKCLILCDAPPPPHPLLEFDKCENSLLETWNFPSYFAIFPLRFARRLVRRFGRSSPFGCGKLSFSWREVWILPNKKNAPPPTNISFLDPLRFLPYGSLQTKLTTPFWGILATTMWWLIMIFSVLFSILLIFFYASDDCCAVISHRLD